MRKRKGKEIWRNVKDYGGKYAISNWGNVRNNNTNRILKKCNGTNGYKVVCLSKNGETKTQYVHRLVGDAFIPKKNDREQINHIDEHKGNNNVENLEWCSKKYNIRYSKTKPITGVCEDHIIVMYALTDCRKLGYYPSTIYNAIQHKRKTYGYSWEYISKETFYNLKRLREKDKNIIVI